LFKLFFSISELFLIFKSFNFWDKFSENSTFSDFFSNSFFSLLN